MSIDSPKDADDRREPSDAPHDDAPRSDAMRDDDAARDGASTTASATPDDRTGAAPAPGPVGEVAAAAPSSPSLNAAPLLRGAAICAVLSAAAGVIIAPGMRGNASEAVVVASERVAGSLAYLLYGLLIALLIRGAFEIIRSRRIHIAMRILIIIGAGATSAMAAPALHAKLPPTAAVILAVGALVAVVPGAWCAMRAAHTRAVGVVLAIFALSALVRLIAWELDAIGNRPDRLLTRMLAVRDVLAGAGIALEGLGQLAAAAWLGTRGRALGQTMSAAAIAGAFLMTWGVAQGIHGQAAPWQAVMHSALADVAALPPPLGAIATFLVCASILLALVAAVQQRQVVAVIAALAFALVSRGSFDAPLRALAAVAGAMWIAVAMGDDRAMWRALVDSRAAVPTPATSRR